MLTRVVKILSGAITLPYRWWLRAAVTRRDFTIISNNCWAGFVYQDLKMEYTSPTAGLFFLPQDYIRFLSRLNHYTSCELSFVDSSRFEAINSFRDNGAQRYPIGVLDGELEVHFLHYHSPEEAAQKWSRRCGRINFDNLRVKMDDHEHCPDHIVEAFDALPFEHKVFFSHKPHGHLSSVVYLPMYRSKECVGQIYNERLSFIFRFNLARWLNGCSR